MSQYQQQDTPDDTHIVFKVPVSSFMSRTRSVSRGHAPSPVDRSSPRPLSPCLVYRSPHESPTKRLPRRPSLPTPLRDDAVTVPLRQCCIDCMPITEESLREGEEWKDKFSRGARRRRSASLGAGPSVDAAAVLHGGIVINVDEVDKRRKSQDFSDDGRRRSGEAHLVHHAPAPVADIPQPELPPASPIEETSCSRSRLLAGRRPHRPPRPQTARRRASPTAPRATASRNCSATGPAPMIRETARRGRGDAAAGCSRPTRRRRCRSTARRRAEACPRIRAARSPSPTCNSVSTSQLPTPMPSPSLPPSLSRRPSHTHTHRHEGSASSTATYDPPASPTPTPHALKMHRRRSFSIPFMKAADILKGVTAISGSTAGSAFTPGV
ncbi:hypothetical protein PLICRDRAFT_699560 [Plicaturopsis crispa FD-325 SS-3]|nr:hypothetical protein PLICRDRAFT_699560 [Plicaturopsis crispa FD-325 SS-3]